MERIRESRSPSPSFLGRWNERPPCEKSRRESGSGTEKNRDTAVWGSISPPNPGGEEQIVLADLPATQLNRGRPDFRHRARTSMGELVNRRRGPRPCLQLDGIQHRCHSNGEGRTFYSEVDACRTLAPMSYCSNLLATCFRVRVPSNDAKRWRDSVESNLRGHDSHGVIRIPQYVGFVREAKLKVGLTCRAERDASDCCRRCQLGSGMVRHDCSIDCFQK